ncbi:MAG: DMT family transporter [Thermosynechococcaceae cyanobacterium]
MVNFIQLYQQRSAQSQWLPMATLCVALLAVSFAPIFIRLSETELGANGTVFNRLLIFAVVFGIGKLIAQWRQSAKEPTNEEPITTQQWILLVSVGLISITSLGLWALSLQYTSVAKCMLLSNLTPIFTSLGAWCCFGKRFDSRFLAGMAVALSGALFLGLSDLSSGDGLLLGDIYALLSAVFLGIYFLLVEQLRQRFSATTILLWRCIIGSAFLLPIVLATEGQVFPTTRIAILAVFGLGLISEGLGQRLLADAMDQFSASFVSLFLLLEPIISAILAWFIFVEHFGRTTWIGFAIVLTGLYFAQTSQSAAQHGETASELVPVTARR